MEHKTLPEYIPTVIFDFDGVIHGYTGSWQGPTKCPGSPVPHIRDAIRMIRQNGYNVIVVSSRCYVEGGIEAIRRYLDLHHIEVDDITGEKPPAVVQIDDRAICFDGDALSLPEKIDDFLPWYHRKES